MNAGATDTAAERLFTAALSADRNLRTRDELEAYITDFGGDRPIYKCHDWRNHVPDAVADEWDDLPLVAKLVAFIQAASLAHHEQWD
jgi:hypothetical protein